MKAVFVLLAVALAGCGDQKPAPVASSGGAPVVSAGQSRYVGTWISDKGNSIIIARQGSALTVTERFKGGKVKDRTYPAQEKNGTVEVMNGVGVTAYVIDETSGKLILGSHKWTKQ